MKFKVGDIVKFRAEIFVNTNWKFTTKIDFENDIFVVDSIQKDKHGYQGYKIKVPGTNTLVRADFENQPSINAFTHYLKSASATEISKYRIKLDNPTKI